jgi:hypothetical protein
MSELQSNRTVMLALRVYTSIRKYASDCCLDMRMSELVSMTYKTRLKDTGVDAKCARINIAYMAEAIVKHDRVLTGRATYGIQKTRG